MAQRLVNGIPSFLFGIGAQKSGTTWIYNLLKSHPECHCSEIKEFHYFDVIHLKGEQVHVARRQELLEKLLRAGSKEKNRNQSVSLEQIARLKALLDMYPAYKGDHSRYRSLVLEGYSNQKIACDITPAYATLDREAFREMASIAPSLFLFTMRDPVDRMWSQIRMFVTVNSGRQTPESLREACVQRVRDVHAAGRLPKIPRANYVRTIKELEASVPSNRILYLFYEDLFNGAGIDRLWRFLDVAQHPAETALRSNPGQSAELPEEAEALLLDGLREQYYAAFERFGDGLPAQWRTRLDALPRQQKGWIKWWLTRRSPS